MTKINEKILLSGIDLEKYREVLTKCPPHESEDFIAFVRDNNLVIDENDEWLLIQNCKYHGDNGSYYTAFLKSPVKYQKMNVTLVFPSEWSSLWRMYQRHCNGWEIKIKRDKHRSVSRFHVHFIE